MTAGHSGGALLHCRVLAKPAQAQHGSIDGTSVWFSGRTPQSVGLAARI
jgi:hypothetical protein